MVCKVWKGLFVNILIKGENGYESNAAKACDKRMYCIYLQLFVDKKMKFCSPFLIFEITPK
jgi:hypothetical protein